MSKTSDDTAVTLPDVPDLVTLPFSLHRDDNLWLGASTRWYEIHLQMTALMAATPTVHATVMALLKDRLALDGEQVGLRFHANDQRTSRSCTLAEALVFIAQHPDLDLAQAPDGHINGLAKEHRWHALPARQLLKELRTLELRQALTQRWTQYWDSRAPGTAMSRSQHALQLYRGHFEAACQLARADGWLDAEQLQVLESFLEKAVQEPKVNGHRVYAEQLLLKRSDGTTLEMPGALVITGDHRQPVIQMLYLATLEPALRLFNGRTDMERWLLKHQQSLFATTDDDAHARIHYIPQHDPLTAGLKQLLAQRQNAQLESAFEVRGSDLAEDATYALSPARAWDAQHRQKVFFAPAPQLSAELADADENARDSDDDPLPFGSLAGNIPLHVRRAALKYQHDALIRLMGEDYAGDRHDDRLSRLKALLDKLQDQVHASSTHATALLNREKPFDSQTISSHYTALYQARVEGLRAEIDIQRTLTQISAGEHRLIAAVLDAEDHIDWPKDIAVARLTVSTSQKDATVTRQELHGALVFLTAAALKNPSSADSLLLYWPGSDGGLQRFANRTALEQVMLRIGEPADSHLSLQLFALDTDPFEYSLNGQHSTYEQAEAQLRTRHTEASSLADALDTLAEQTRLQLLVPHHAVRSLACAQFVELNQTAALTARMPEWLGQLPAPDHSQLKSLLSAYLEALRRADELLEQQLPAASDFSQQQVDIRLRKDFALKGDFTLTVDLPDSVTAEQHFIEGAAPGTPTRTVQVPSRQRSKLSLYELALIGTAAPMSARLGFMQLEITTDDEQERRTLQSGITAQYLASTLTELDVAEQYHQKILDTYLGTGTAPAFEREHRRETLLAPYQLMLKIQGLSSRLQKQIDASAWQMLDTAIHADTPEGWSAHGQRLVLRAARLRSDIDNGNDQTTSLAGINFIEDQLAGTTLLLLPDSPDQVFLRRFDTLELARQALFNLCLRQDMVEYLASRAIKGDVSRHKARIDQAVLKNYDALIDAGEPWPASLSLASVLLNAEMGRIRETHRQTSRANSDVFLEQYAVRAQQALTYMKMAIAVVPFVGVSVAVYDIWTQANQAVDAFRKGKNLRAVEALNGVLVSFVEAGMSVVTGFNINKSMDRIAALLASIRKLSVNLIRRLPASRSARHIAVRFEGYEYKKAISLHGIQVANEGIYRNVYRHAAGDFIRRGAKIYQVQLDNQARFWRLSATRSKTYRQPLALDENGHWDTYYGVHGKMIDGGGLGGADRPELPVSQALISQLPPSWMSSVGTRRGEMARLVRLYPGLTLQEAEFFFARFTFPTALEAHFLTRLNDVLEHTGTITEQFMRHTRYHRGDLMRFLSKTAPGIPAQPVPGPSTRPAVQPGEQWTAWGTTYPESFVRPSPRPNIFEEVKIPAGQVAQRQSIRINGLYYPILRKGLDDAGAIYIFNPKKSTYTFDEFEQLLRHSPHELPRLAEFNTSTSWWEIGTRPLLDKTLTDYVAQALPKITPEVRYTIARKLFADTGTGLQMTASSVAELQRQLNALRSRDWFREFSYIDSTTHGNLRLTNSASDSFNRLEFSPRHFPSFKAAAQATDAASLNRLMSAVLEDSGYQIIAGRHATAELIFQHPSSTLVYRLHLERTRDRLLRASYIIPLPPDRSLLSPVNLPIIQRAQAQQQFHTLVGGLLNLGSKSTATIFIAQPTLSRVRAPVWSP